MLKTTLLFLFFSLLISCSRYSLVQERDLPYQSVAVIFEENQTYQPQVKASLINHTRQSILRDGTTHLTSSEHAEAILVMRIIDFEREIISTEENDTARVENYNIKMVVEADFTLKSGDVLFENVLFTANKPVRSPTGEFGLVIDQDIPYLTQQIAKDITLAITGAW